MGGILSLFGGQKKPKPPPVPNKNSEEVGAEALRQRQLAANANGRASTILTPLGTPSSAPISSASKILGG